MPIEVLGLIVKQDDGTMTAGGQSIGGGLQSTHSHATSEVTGLDTALAAKEASANKGAANGYAPLGADGKVPSANLPAGGSPIDSWPVGSIFIGVVSTSPATLLGGGTWQAIGAGRVLVGLDAADPDFDTAEETGGAKTVQSSAQNFAGSSVSTSQDSAGTPAGTVSAIAATATAAVKIGTSGASAAAQTHTHPAPTFTGSALGNHGHTVTAAGTNTPGAATSVVQPYLCVYFWKRLA